MTFNAEDIVRIVKQPPNEPVSLVDEVGFIDEMSERYCSIRTLKLDGGLNGTARFHSTAYKQNCVRMAISAYDRYKTN